MTPNSTSAQRVGGVDFLLVTGLALLWAQFYYTTSPVWIGGDYYDYAWFVPPIAAYFFYRRWQQRPGFESSRLGEWGLLVVSFLLLPFLFAIRALEGFDPSWRPPMLLHAAVAASVSHWILWRRGGWKFSLSFIPVTIFAFSAVPIPYQLENRVIAVLTGWVVQAAGFLFHFMGQPVQVYGSVIELDGNKVQVTEGCSGIQSLQSLTMVSLYLGEFFRMKMMHRFMLPAFAVVVALTVNVGRAIYLARVRFAEGEAAFDAAHDSVGHTAFAIGGVILLLIARLLVHRADSRNKTLRRTHRKIS